MPIQVIQKPNPQNTLANAIMAFQQGFTGSRDKQLSDAKTRAEMEKLNAEIPYLQSQSKLFSRYADTLGGDGLEPVQQDQGGNPQMDEIMRNIEALKQEYAQASAERAKRPVAKSKATLSPAEDVLGLGL